MAGCRTFFSVKPQETEYVIEYRYVQNYTPSRIYLVNSIVVHTMTDVPDNNIDGVANWFDNPTSGASAHYGVSTGGRILQFVDLINTAWANGVQKSPNKWKWSGNPNPRTVSIECEGGPDDPVTNEMYNAVKYVCQRVLLGYPSIKYLYAHNAIANTQCPGPRWTSGKLQQLGNELGLEVVI